MTEPALNVSPIRSAWPDLPAAPVALANTKERIAELEIKIARLGEEQRKAEADMQSLATESGGTDEEYQQLAKSLATTPAAKRDAIHDKLDKIRDRRLSDARALDRFSDVIESCSNATDVAHNEVDTLTRKERDLVTAYRKIIHDRLIPTLEQEAANAIERMLVLRTFSGQVFKLDVWVRTNVNNIRVDQLLAELDATMRNELQ